MHRTRMWLVLSLLVGCAPAASDSSATDTSQEDLSTNSDVRKLLVYSNNIENMVYDWKDLVDYMATSPTRPDLFLVQQMTDSKRMDELTTEMTQRLGVAYAGRVAQANPTNVRQGSEVSPPPTVTTGIVYRTARFDVLSQETWFPFGLKNPTTGVTDCTLRHDSSAYETIKLRLHDKLANRDVVAVSLRHPTGSPCPAENVADIATHLPARVGLTIVGGDFNDDPTATSAHGACWYRSMVGAMTACTGAPDFHFADPLYDDCAGDMTCVQKRQGIDFIFGRNFDSTPAKTGSYRRASFVEGNAANVAVTGSDGLSNTLAADGFTDASSNYSQHEARSAYVWYPP